MCSKHKKLNQYQVYERTPQSQKDQRAALELHVSDSPPTCTLSGGVRDQCFAFKNIIEPSEMISQRNDVQECVFSAMNVGKVKHLGLEPLCRGLNLLLPELSQIFHTAIGPAVLHRKDI